VELGLCLAEREPLGEREEPLVAILRTFGGLRAAAQQLGIEMIS
jgi:hypothetical protein